MVQALRGPAVVAAVYLILRFAFDRVTATYGLLAPSGVPHLGVAALGLVVIALRVGVVCVLPPVVAARLVRVGLRSIAARRRPA
jgi:hypothetical protein